MLSAPPRAFGGPPVPVLLHCPLYGDTVSIIRPGCMVDTKQVSTVPYQRVTIWLILRCT